MALEATQAPPSATREAAPTNLLNQVSPPAAISKAAFRSGACLAAIEAADFATGGETC